MKKYYKHMCQCGCGGKIEIIDSHKYDGIPKYIKDHNFRKGYWTGKKRTPEDKVSIGNGVKRALSVLETKKKMQKPKAEAHKNKISITVQKLWRNKEYREKNTGKNSYLYKDGISIRKHYCIECGKELKNNYAKRCGKCSNKEIRNRPEIRRAHSKLMKVIMKQRWGEGIFDGVFRSPTKPEKNIMKILKKLKIGYVFQFRPVGYSLTYDFYIPFLTLLIEFDGVYWHSLPKVKLRDRAKTKYAYDYGYNLLRFNEENLGDFQNTILDKLNKEVKNEILCLQN